MNQPTTMPLANLFRDFTNGDETTWTAERAWIEANHPNRLARIRREIQAGHFPPVRLDFAEKRVIDGHHRLIAAASLGCPDVPVADVWDGSDWATHASAQGHDDEEAAA